LLEKFVLRSNTIVMGARYAKIIKMVVSRAVTNIKTAFGSSCYLPRKS
jgi:hypothetical protein